MATVKIISEIGINHNSHLEIAEQLIRIAAASGSDFVKFQKRFPAVDVPRSQWDAPKVLEDGTTVSYFQYKEKMEFSEAEYREVNRFSKENHIPWFASAWGKTSADWLVKKFPSIPYIKIPSAMNQDKEFLKHVATLGKDVILSTGMGTMKDIQKAVEWVKPKVIMHCTATYPCPPEEVNLLVIRKLIELYPELEIGYSGHETGLAPTLAAVAIGATWVERHITIDRSMWGSDQAASLEPTGLTRLVKDIRLIERSLGDGNKKLEPGELKKIASLRG